MQPFPPLLDFTYLLVPLTIRMVRPISNWYLILEFMSILTYRSGIVYNNYCTLVACLFITTVLLYFNMCLTFRYVKKHIHYRLGQSIIDVFSDYETWICIAEMIILVVFIFLGYIRYKQLRSKDPSPKHPQLFS